MAVVIRLQGLPIVAGTMDIRHFFSGLTIPDGGVHIVGGELDGRVHVPGGAVRALPESPRQRPGIQVGALLRRRQDAGGGRWAELDCMEKIKNCQDPEFCKKLVVDYYFEKVQKLKFGVYDIDSRSSDLNDDDYLGGIECTLGQVVSSSVFTGPLELKQGKPAAEGTIMQRRLRIPGLYTWKLKPKTWTKRDKLFPAFGFGAQVPPSWQYREYWKYTMKIIRHRKKCK